MPKMNSVESPKDERQFGEIEFNYASYDGRFVIGTKPWTFETYWGVAGPGLAHLMNDPADIEGVAIAEGIVGIGQVTPEVVAAADFTSRVRTPSVGQVALLRNTAGFYAAVEPVVVGYSSSPTGNIMRLRFAINKDRSTDFSSFASAFTDRQAQIDQLIIAVENAERALQAVPVGNSAETVAGVGIGHNQPPAEFAITEVDRAETFAALAIVRQDVMSPLPSTGRIRAAAQTIARVASKVAKWISGKADIAADEFAKTVGKAVGVVTIGGVAVWLTLQVKLTLLADILGKFVG